MSFEVRRLTYADLPQVVANERLAFPAPWSLAMFVLELSKPNGICLAAVEAEAGGGHETVRGHLICSRHDAVWHIMNIAVHPEHRRRGIARALMDELLARLPEGDRAQLTLEVRESNRPALAMYETYDFKPAGVRRRYYQDNGEDALILWRTPGTLKGNLDDVPNPDRALTK
jgi:[ribosomal protein S18]-alanine N-acetyltransferase